MNHLDFWGGGLANFEVVYFPGAEGWGYPLGRAVSLRGDLALFYLSLFLCNFQEVGTATLCYTLQATILGMTLEVLASIYSQ